MYTEVSGELESVKEHIKSDVLFLRIIVGLNGKSKIIFFTRPVNLLFLVNDMFYTVAIHNDGIIFSFYIHYKICIHSEDNTS